MASGIDLNPSAGGWTAALDDRADRVANGEKKWMYQRYAYFKLRSMSALDGDKKNDNESIFTIAQSNSFSGGIGRAYTGGFLESFHYKEGDKYNIKKLRPSLTSATINVHGGNNLYDAYIKHVNVSFKVYTTSDLNKVQTSFFLPGARARIEYGWIGESGKGSSFLKNAGETIRIYNFGFTMNKDGSYDCNIKALTEGFFSSGQAANATVTLTPDEQKALGPQVSKNSTTIQALIAKAYLAFGTPGEEREDLEMRLSQDAAAATGNASPFPGTPASSGPGFVLVGGATDHEGMNASAMGLSADNFWMGVYKNLEQDSEEIHPYVKFSTLIRYIQKNNETKFKFDTVYNIITDTHEDGIGSADPRRYILPDFMSTYDPSAEYVQRQAPAAADWIIEDILISLDTVELLNNEVAIAKNNVSMKPVVVTTTDLIRALSHDMNRLTGGLVDIQIRPSKSTSGEFIIYNRRTAPKPKGPYTFTVLGRKSIVKDVSLSSDFNVDEMAQFTIGRVRSGDYNDYAIAKQFPSVSGVVDKDGAVQGIDQNSLDETKTSIGQGGIDDALASSLATNMRKYLTMGSSGGVNLFSTIPFNLKLSVTVEGIDGIRFLEPISVDRLPSDFRGDNVRFLVMGLAHTFDGQGGWDTTIETAMTMGDV